ncbi:MAG: DNA-binding protein [Mesorhizobium sp.]|uniref:helix-turn-helix domain-containing protein n=1 Tax=unclassified Mesorhizobium TaxID=325217 RepID=UPI000FCA6DB1|nr:MULTISPECIES: helix-turn-helix domain-containing protein [unclassified Mesorhizobium]RUW42981.1 DNA-binding protein [Mesorhizobium sp. M2A.F.Ca.ET.015.02.1.1]RVC93868.1 DNA-binding protein [Mesorhizobium sp. M2A.F.Ca.ET.017.03.2.1]RVC99994.1 DNA-binding protein [Mesorhizobium sp. M2A.F.Ca.ET.029.05.1.1]RWB47568.1 MAG: DNA-binding protein [Mesorhizobium sp.]RWB62099.1 MAG: DNA-binding protein [Mesorhizobium sp.]
MNSTNFEPAEAGRYLGPEGHPIPASTLQWWRSTGRGPKYFKVGRRILYSQQHLDEYRESCLRQPEVA